ncbi:MAG: hypothetical protein AAFQ91_30140, partial [Cyanobacteria bacterium J06621_15]
LTSTLVTWDKMSIPAWSIESETRTLDITAYFKAKRAFVGELVGLKCKNAVLTAISIQIAIFNIP